MQLGKIIAASLSSAKALCDADELTSVAYEVVAEAIRTHDPARSSLRSRVSSLVEYRIYDHMRKMDHLSRGERGKIDAKLAYDRSHGDTYLEYDACQPDRLPVSLDNSKDGERELWELIAAKDAHPVYGILVEELLSILPDRKLEIIRMYFWGNLTMKEIGKKFGINESRVSQLIDSATSLMRELIDETGMSLGENWGSRRPFSDLSR